MPFDGLERDWEPRPSSRGPWYTVHQIGQRKRKKRWLVEALIPGWGESPWWPVASIYADTKRQAYGIAWGIMQGIRETIYGPE